MPHDIERRSFELIEQELPHPLDSTLAPIIKRVIHTTADFDYVDTLYFSEDALTSAFLALKGGASIITDTNMALAGINKPALAKLNCSAYCFMADEDVAVAAGLHGSTRASAAMDKASSLTGPLIFAVGNAPTALVRLYEHIVQGSLQPALVIGVPVGFVNVIQAKELILQTSVPCIVAKGRKGGSNVAAAIVNALLYQLTRSEPVGSPSL
ncbi:MAG: precorrin-8X methylmutase [Eubacteriales bacterium]